MQMLHRGLAWMLSRFTCSRARSTCLVLVGCAPACMLPLRMQAIIDKWMAAHSPTAQSTKPTNAIAGLHSVAANAQVLSVSAPKH
jgi:hypothetical protein